MSENNMIGQLFKDRVIKACKRLSNEKPGKPEYIAMYQAAMQEVKKALTEEEWEKVRSSREEWNSKQPKVNVQRE